ncbi:hypothetical protein D1007_17250 [Hordeum vulgare]|nr:hypothetical protein D1007_17250 [Hordeum vulgare]
MGWEADPSSPHIHNEIWREGNFRTAVLPYHPFAAIASPPSAPVHLPRPFFAAMEASQPSPVTVDVAHAQFPPTYLIAGHVAPAIAQGTTVHIRKRQGNVIVQGGNPAGPAAAA